MLVSNNGNTGINRLIIIGNGFDLAHKLPTRYCDFIDWLWLEISKSWSSPLIILKNEERDVLKEVGPRPSFSIIEKEYDKRIMGTLNPKPFANCIEFQNMFFKGLTEKRGLSQWVDIEMFYFEELERLIKGVDKHPHALPLMTEKVRKLNLDLDQLVKMFEEYLVHVVRPKIQDNLYYQSIGETIFKNSLIGRVHLEDFFAEFPFNPKKVNIGGGIGIFRDHIKNKMGEGGLRRYKNTLVLNFNYTHTPELYSGFDHSMKLVYIHGRVLTSSNPLILGFGDENSTGYKRMEDLNSYELIRMAKSVKYPSTGNYKELVDFISEDPFQAYVVGHSCAISDRTLLSSIFENPNCISIKPFYYKYSEANAFGECDNYSELVANISRHFSDKKSMRDKVVNKEMCSTIAGSK